MVNEGFRVVVAGILIRMAVGSELDASEPLPVVTVRVVDVSGAFNASLVRAQEVATAVFREAGVLLRWVPDATASEKPLTLVVSRSNQVDLRFGADAMGTAERPVNGTPSTRAYVFSDRITAFAKKNGVPLGVLLGCIVAHEIGHLLLPPNAHRPRTIMRAEWRRDDFPPRVPAIWGFASDHARLLRLRAANR